MEVENIKNNQLDIKNAITEIKNALQGINNRVDEANNQISDLEYKKAENTQLEQQKEKKIEKIRTV